MLFIVSFAIELAALLMTIGLGLYLVTRGMRRPEAWLAALTAWAMGGLFLNMLYSLSPPPIPYWLSALLLFWPRGILEQDASAWLHGWTSTLAPAFWFHGTMLMRLESMTARHRLAVAGVYLLSLTGISIQALSPENYKSVSGDPLYLNALHGSQLYGIFLVFLVLICSLSIRNLSLAARARPRYLPRRQLILLSSATILAGLTGPVGLVAGFLRIPVPMFLVALLIAAGIMATGFGVARYSALMESRVFERDFFYSLFSNSAAVALYLAVTWLASLVFHYPPYFFVVVSVLAVISHMLIDVARQNVDFLFFQQEKRLLRARLRSLAGQDEVEILKDLSRLLDNICEPIQASCAVLLVSKGDKFEQLTAYRWKQAQLTLPASLMAADDLKPLQSTELPEPLAKGALLIPIYQADQQVAALLVGEALNGLAYSPIELDGLLEFGDYLGAWLAQATWRRVLADPIMQDFSAKPELSEDSQGKISIRSVELGLRNLNDYSRLAELPLAKAEIVSRRCGKKASHIETGKAVNSLLCEALEQLCPADFEEVQLNKVPRRDHYPYLVLRDAYIDCFPNREIMDRLYISEGTFHRIRRAAIRSLTRLLLEMEDQAAPA